MIALDDDNVSTPQKRVEDLNDSNMRNRSIAYMYICAFFALRRNAKWTNLSVEIQISVHQ